MYRGRFDCFYNILKKGESKMKIEISDNLISKVIKLRSKVDIPPSKREDYKEIIAVMIDRLLRWAVSEIHESSKEKGYKNKACMEVVRFWLTVSEDIPQSCKACKFFNVCKIFKEERK